MQCVSWDAPHEVSLTAATLRNAGGGLITAAAADQLAGGRCAAAGWVARGKSNMPLSFAGYVVDGA